MNSIKALHSSLVDTFSGFMLECEARLQPEF